MSTKKKLKTVRIDVDVTCRALVIHYTLQPVDETGAEEAIPGQKLIKVSSKVLQADVSATAQDIVKNCKYIQSSKVSDVERSLQQLFDSWKPSPRRSPLQKSKPGDLEISLVVRSALTNDLLAEVRVHPKETIHTLRLVAQEAANVALGVFIIDGEMLNDSSTLLECNIQDGACIQALIKERHHGIYSNDVGSAQLKVDGSVITKGPGRPTSDKVLAQLKGGVKAVYTTDWAYAALKEDGSVVSWGDPDLGGDGRRVMYQLAGGVQTISSTDSAFAALKDDGTVVMWGDKNCGGESRVLQRQLADGVLAVSSTKKAFAALKDDHSVISWGGQDLWDTPINTSGVERQLAQGVQSIFATALAFAALKEDGSVVAWGHKDHGGDLSQVQDQLRSGVAAICSAETAFAALRNDGSLVAWGNQVDVEEAKEKARAVWINRSVFDPRFRDIDAVCG